MSNQHPHQGQPVLTAGVPLAQARLVMILVHGRGATAESILSLAPEFNQPDVAYLAPQAAGWSWYPYSFLAPLEQNQPYLDSALQVLAGLVAQLESQGVKNEQLVLGGFSQGACLTLEFVARNARPYGGVFAFSGGLIGPAGTPRNYAGSLANTPIFIGCSDQDSHIPLVRVQESTQVLQGLGGRVTEKIYPRMGHTVNEDEIWHVQQMLTKKGVGSGE